MKSMHPMKPLITAGLFAALGLAPAAFAQSTGTAPATPSTQTAAAAQTASSGTDQQQTSGGSANQEAARQALAAARQSLAELTKLPAASSLQGEQRTAVANFISEFNAFATAQNDWRSKYQAVDESLNRLLGEASAAPPSGSTASTTPTTPSTAGAPAPAAAAGTGALDPTIIAKLQEVRTHLTEFEKASGDPLFAVDAIQKQLDAASTSGASAGVTLSAAQVEEIRKQLETIRQAAKK
jgi:hypothetical protein